VNRPAGRRLALAALTAVATVLVAGCTGDPTGSPVQTIPKVIVDYFNNTTTITLTSLNADVRYANISLRLENENLSAPLAFSDDHAYALTAKTNLTYFLLNASADEGRSFYYYNASMHIVERAGTAGTDHPQWQIFIRDTPLGNIQTQTIPFTRLLEEGRL
jgi:hypothetical protein